MRRWSLSMLFVSLVVFMSVALAPSPAAYAGQANIQSSTTSAAGTTIPKHGTFTVELVRPLDSKKLKKGNEVEAKLMGGITLPNGSKIPRGARVIGHVTEAKARSKNDAASVLGISFDKIAEPPADTPIRGVIQAVAPNPDVELNSGGPIEYNDLSKNVAVLTPDTGRGPTPLLNETSVGVFGIKNLQLDPNGVLTSAGKEVKLDGGTRMLLSVTIQ
jgi:hypothetical protein